MTGTISANAAYEIGNAVMVFDNSKTSITEIEEAINSAEYSVVNKKEK